MKRTLIAVSITMMLLCTINIQAKTTSNQKSSNKKGELIKSDVISGDFDGDGKIDKIWTEGRYDEDGFAIGKIKLCSDNPKLAGMTWDGIMGVSLSNLGKLGGSSVDLLGLIPYSMSTWCSFDTFIFVGRKWKPAIESFTVWLGDDSELGVVKAKSGRPGYVGIYYNDMEHPDDDMDNIYVRQYKEVKLNF